MPSFFVWILLICNFGEIDFCKMKMGFGKKLIVKIDFWRDKISFLLNHLWPCRDFFL